MSKRPRPLPASPYDLDAIAKERLKRSDRPKRNHETESLYTLSQESSLAALDISTQNPVEYPQWEDEEDL